MQVWTPLSVHSLRRDASGACSRDSALPLGDTYVRFNTALEREKFLGTVFSFGNYSMTVIKHDEGDNVRSYDLDREA